MSNTFSAVASLGRDAEFSHVGQSGMACLTLSLAVNTGYGDKKKTIWVRGSIWGKRAESNLKDHLKKGQQVFVTGELSQSEFTGNDGIKKTVMELSVNQIDLVGGKRESAPAPAPTPAPQPVATPAYDDDIPF